MVIICSTGIKQNAVIIWLAILYMHIKCLYFSWKFGPSPTTQSSGRKSTHISKYWARPWKNRPHGKWMEQKGWSHWCQENRPFHYDMLSSSLSLFCFLSLDHLWYLYSFCPGYNITPAKAGSVWKTCMIDLTFVFECWVKQHVAFVPCIVPPLCKKPSRACIFSS